MTTEGLDNYGVWQIQYRPDVPQAEAIALLIEKGLLELLKLCFFPFRALKALTTGQFVEDIRWVTSWTL